MFRWLNFVFGSDPHGRARDSFREQRLHEDNDNAPAPLPPTRRPLSQLDPAAQPCLFFLRLPPEIRLRIYEQVVGGRVVHLFLLRRRLAHVRCAEPAGDLERRCIKADHVPIEQLHKLYGPSAPHLDLSSANVAFLQSCRRVYQEAIDVLYKANVFDVNHPQTFVLFARTVPSQRLASITSLQVTWAHPDLPSAIEKFYGLPDGLPRWWGPLWEIVVTQMPRLKHLRVRLDMCGRNMPWEEEEALLQPLLSLRGLTSFELDVPRSQDKTSPAYPYVELSPLGRRMEEIVCADAV